jgi:hypothetical protein
MSVPTKICQSETSTDTPGFGLYFLTSPYLELNLLITSLTLLLSVIGLHLAGISSPITEIFNV